MSEGLIPISEIFCSIQGEGPRIGVPAVFVRFWGCNLSCSFCDSRFAWDKRVEAPRAQTTEQIAAAISAHPTGNLIFTGGEPMLFQPAIRAICAAVSPSFVEVETNGTIASTVDDLVGQFNVSPKFDFANPVLLKPSPQTIWKFVIRDEADLKQADAFCAERQIAFDRVWLQPEGVTRDVLTRSLDFLIQAAAERGAQVSPRLHILLWGDRRGV